MVRLYMKKNHKLTSILLEIVVGEISILSKNGIFCKNNRESTENKYVHKKFTNKLFKLSMNQQISNN